MLGSVCRTVVGAVAMHPAGTETALATSQTRVLTRFAAVLLPVLILSACGGSSSDDSSATASPTTLAPVTAVSPSTAAPTDTMAPPTAPDTTTATVDAEPFVLVGGAIPSIPDVNYDIVSCTRYGDTGLILEATSPDDPAMKLSIDAESGSGTVILTESGYPATDVVLVTGDPTANAYFGLDPESVLSVGGVLAPWLVYVSC